MAMRVRPVMATTRRSETLGRVSGETPKASGGQHSILLIPRIKTYDHIYWIRISTQLSIAALLPNATYSYSEWMVAARWWEPHIYRHDLEGYLRVKTISAA
jgi:hypothetical protein